jgi:hypothetical protein
MADCIGVSAEEAHADKIYRHIIGQLTCLGRHTVTGILCSTKQQFKDWSADYRLYSENRFCQDSIFACITGKVCSALEPGQPVVAVMDDTLLRKTGKRTVGNKYQRDPLSPPFHTNLTLAQRAIQISAAIPNEDSSAEMIPIDFIHAPLPKKPKPKASSAEWAVYEKQRLQSNINLYGARRIQQLRERIDSKRKLIVAVDNRFTTSTLLQHLPENVTFIGRVRRDAHFETACFERTGKRGRPRKYLAKAPTPLELLGDETIPWQEVSAFAAGEQRVFRVKSLNNLRWQAAGCAKIFRLLVVAPVGYRLTKEGKLLKREPAFFMCSDTEMPLQEILQTYLWRWGIECNFRDEKTLLGVGQAQVRSQHSIQKAPALAVAAYSILLLGALAAFRSEQAAMLLPKPKWQRYPQRPNRPSTAQLINQLRTELWASAVDLHILRDFCSSTTTAKNSFIFNSTLKSAAFFATQ